MALACVSKMRNIKMCIHLKEGGLCEVSVSSREKT